MAASETCARCGQEVRWGTRGEFTGYLHREDVDHIPIFGTPWSREAEAAWDAALDVPRERYVPTETGWPLLFTIETYTTREFDIARMKKAAREALAELDEDAEESNPLEPIEVLSTPIERADHRCPQGVKNVINKAAKADFAIVRLTYARGPYVSPVKGSLGLSDTVVLGLEGPVVDGRSEHAVASWRDGKADWAYRIDTKNRPTRISVTELKAWMSKVPCRQAAAQIQEALHG